VWVTPVGTASPEPESAGGGGAVAKAAAQEDRGRGGTARCCPRDDAAIAPLGALPGRLADPRS
jgi:hypothetical protein